MSPLVLRALRAVGVALALAGCASDPPLQPPPIESVEPDLSALTLGQGDIVRVTVFGHPEASTRAEGERVDIAGELSLPYVGAIPVAGRTPGEARDLIREGLARIYRDPGVGVSVLQYGARRFFIIGEVTAPGAYVIDRPLTVLQALAYGGQVKAGAKRDRVMLLRREGPHLQRFEFDSTDPSISGLVAVRPDDVIFVPRSRNGYFKDEILPYLQGAGFAAAIPVGMKALLQ